VARRVVVEKLDDLDGSPATRTVRFGLEGVDYELDLSEENAQELTHWLQDYISHARRVSGRKRAARHSVTSDAAAVRQWAQEQGIHVNARGRIPSQVVDEYAASMNG
jgi:hypothetical protein